MTRGPVPAEGFPRADRILSRTDFLRVQREGKRVHTPNFVIMVLAGGSQRLGITVTRKAAGSVGRNRALFPRCELVLVARRGAERLGYAAVLGEITQANAALQRAAGETSRRPNHGEASS